MTRKRAEKLLTAAFCGRGIMARDAFRCESALNAGASNAEVLLAVVLKARVNTAKCIASLLEYRVDVMYSKGELGPKYDAAIKIVDDTIKHARYIGKGLDELQKKLKKMGVNKIWA